MAEANIYDWIKQETTTGGNSATLTLTTVTGFVPFNQAVPIGEDVWYTIRNGATLEIGIGALTSSTVFNRHTPRRALFGGTYNASPIGPVFLSGTSEIGIAPTALAIEDKIQIETLTQTEYDAIPTPDSEIFYHISDATPLRIPRVSNVADIPARDALTLQQEGDTARVLSNINGIEELFLWDGTAWDSYSITTNTAVQELDEASEVSQVVIPGSAVTVNYGNATTITTTHGFKLLGADHGVADEIGAFFNPGDIKALGRVDIHPSGDNNDSLTFVAESTTDSAGLPNSAGWAVIGRAANYQFSASNEARTAAFELASNATMGGVWIRFRIAGTAGTSLTTSTGDAPYTALIIPSARIQFSVNR